MKCLGWLCLLALSGVACAHRGEPEKARAPQLGVTHVGGSYNLGETSKDFLNQGADEILALGACTIKLWFTNAAGSYSYNSQWPGSFDSLVAMAKHPYYRAVFEKPFDTYILVVYSLGRPEHHFTDGIDRSALDDETRQFHELSAYLLTRYAGTGKTFILQHWEGDWAVRGHFDPNRDPTPEALDGMVSWLNARQAGVDLARKEVGEHGVHVYHAAEVNLVEGAMLQGRPAVVNRVLPRTRLDLVSYSSWETLSEPARFRRALDYIAENMPDREPFGARNVYLGEYGWPENDAPDKAHDVVRNATETAIEWGCPFVVYWELFCNEPKRTPVEKNDDVRGLWLIRPDGTKAWAWDYLHELLGRGGK